MRIEFSQTGGLAYLPGLSKPVTIDVDHLDKADIEELQRLVQAARFFTLPSVVGVPARGAADYQQYILTIEEGGRQHTVRILVPVEDEALHELVRAVQRHAKAARAAGSGTPSTPKVRKPRR